MDFAAFKTEHQRLSILRFLADAGGYSLNTSILHDGLGALGLEASRDKVEVMAAWLAEQGLVTVERVRDVKVVKLTTRGLDVAGGHAAVPGVKRPSPGE